MLSFETYLTNKRLKVGRGVHNRLGTYFNIVMNTLMPCGLTQRAPSYFH